MMTREEGITLMESSKSENEWNVNCEKVKTAHGGGYPDWWFSAIVQSGLVHRVAATFGADPEITIQPIRLE